MKPAADAAANQSTGMFHAKYPTASAVTHAIGMARVAGQRSPTSRPPARRSGNAAIPTSIAVVMALPPDYSHSLGFDSNSCDGLSSSYDARDITVIHDKS